MHSLFIIDEELWSLELKPSVRICLCAGA